MTLYEQLQSAQIDNSSSTTSRSPVIGCAVTKPNMDVKEKSDLSSSSRMSSNQASDGAAKQKAMDVKERSEHHECSVCHEHASLLCKACKGTPDGAGGITGVYYCSAACQKHDWPSHKIQCKAAKDRRILYRAGEIAQRLFIVFCRASWCSVIDKWDIIQARYMWVDIGRCYTGPVWRLYHGHRITNKKEALLGFPVDKFPLVHDQESVLTRESCREAMYTMEKLIGTLLKGKPRSLLL